MKFGISILLICLAAGSARSEESVKLGENQNHETKVSFSPHGECQQMVVDLVHSAKETLDIAVYAVNNKAIVASIEEAQHRKIKIRMLADHTQAGGNRSTTLRLSKDLISYRLNSVDKIMHDKFAIADDHEVITGSFNWTENAQLTNAENCLSTNDPDVVGAFGDQFERVLWPENSQSKSDIHLSKIKAKAEAKK